jgi:dienelactone hydrolase
VPGNKIIQSTDHKTSKNLIRIKFIGLPKPIHVIKRFYNTLPSAWWKGVFVGMIIVVLSISVSAGLLFPSGLPIIVNTIAGLLGGVILLYLLSLVFWLLQKLTVKLPASVALMFLAAVTTLILLKSVLRLPDKVYNVSMLVLIFLVAFIGGTTAFLRQTSFANLTSLQKSLISLGIVISVTVSGWSIYWLASPGGADINQWETKQTKVADSIQALDIEDPSAKGKYSVKTIFYGSGKNKRRTEYGEKVNLKTSTVDASLLLSDWKEFKKKAREWYWGFGIKEFPLNGQVWYPEGDGPFPLVLIVHGNHGMEDYSDPGYAYLGELLASRGFILVSVDENFVNGTWSGDFVGKEMQVRAWLLLQHLKSWREWNQTRDHLFYEKVNLDNIALIGHSRGGEAISIAKAFNHLSFYPDDSEIKFDFNFNIKSLISIAPTDRRYTRRMNLKNVNYLTLQGGLDSDEPSFFGMRQAERIVYNQSDSNYFFKAGIYTPGGNHGQFNSSWRTDASAPYSWFLNDKPLIKEEDQQQMAKVYISGFLESTLHQKKEYLLMFKHWAYAKKWLPAIPYLNRFEDNRTTIIAGYEEDIDLTTASKSEALITAEGLKVWREAELFYRDGKDKQNNSAVILGWKNEEKEKSLYSIELKKPISLAVDDEIVLSFSAGDPGELKKKIEEKDENEKEKTGKKEDKSKKETPPDLSIVLIDSLGTESSIPLQDYIDVLPRWKIQYMKMKDLSGESYGSEWEPTLGDYQLPLSSFISKTPALNIKLLKRIEFRFDRSPSGVVMLDKIGFRAKN